MSITEVIWVVFLVLALQPLLRQRALVARRFALLRALENRRGTRVISLIHRTEVVNLLGVPLVRYINLEDSEAVLRAIRLTAPDVPIDIILHTPGGLALAAQQIATALARHPAKVTIFVPHYAMSGGTLIALAGNQIVMDPDAVLGPVDPQIGEHAAASVLSVVQHKPIERISDDTLMMADVAQKATRQLRGFVITLTARSLGQDRAVALAEALTSGQWTHDYPISATQATQLGLPVSTDMPREIYELMELYPQQGSRRPSVEFIPAPHPSASRPLPGATRADSLL